MTEASSAEVNGLRDRLRALEPRSAQALVRRLVQGESRAGCAAAFGISPEAFDVKLWRALQAFSSPGEAALPPFEAELGQAEALARALDQGGSPLDPSLRGPLDEARHLQALAEPLQAALDAATRADEVSPARKREEWVRRGAIAVILALTAYFYWRSPR